MVVVGDGQPSVRAQVAAALFTTEKINSDSICNKVTRLILLEFSGF
jgi:hypothetical protein